MVLCHGRPGRPIHQPVFVWSFWFLLLVQTLQSFLCWNMKEGLCRMQIWSLHTQVGLADLILIMVVSSNTRRPTFSSLNSIHLGEKWLFLGLKKQTKSYSRFRNPSPRTKILNGVFISWNGTINCFREIISSLFTKKKDAQNKVYIHMWWHWRIT